MGNKDSGGLFITDLGSGEFENFNWDPSIKCECNGNSKSGVGAKYRNMGNG
jgi:hypothetical protein